ncbi:MAG: hypothetical protein ACT4PV_00830 [Planctomycetaceae bacterium]
MGRAAGALLLVACGCAASRSDPAPGPTLPSSEPAGWLEGRPVTYDEIARHLRSKDPDLFARTLEGVLLERLARSEAKRLGLAVPPALLARETTRRLREWEARLQEAARRETGRGTDSALWLRTVAGLTPEEFRALVRRHTEVEMLQDRLLRRELLVTERVEVSLLIVEGEAKAREVEALLAGGAEFGALARERSTHATAPTGGRLEFPLLRQDIGDEELARRLFLAQPGQWLAPATPRVGEGTALAFYRLEAIHAPVAGAPGDLAEAVERDLEARPVPVGEYERWRRRVFLRHGFLAAPPPRENA